ncbi:hypothetical protein [Streptomyces sp. CAU 1734]|uniref:hypothetical protein n=1 Tax=Streptomyces sp. CAU 1734 TaxID=3140360 RepID=UPI003260CB69
MYVKDIQEGLTYERANDAGRWLRVKVTRIWASEAGPAVAFDAFGADGRDSPSTTHSAMSVNRFAEVYRPDAATSAVLYATPEDAANAAKLHPGDRVVTIEIEYIRARVGRWQYDGKVSRVDGSTQTFAYRDRQGRERTTNRFSPVK